LAEEKTISSKLIYKGHAINVRVDTIRKADGSESTRDIVEHVDCIAVVPVDAAGDIWLVKQYRKAVEKELLEIPAGGIDPGETPEEAVKRELQEEIGMEPAQLRRLGGYYSSPGYASEYLHLFLAWDLKPGRLFAEDTDAIVPVRIKPEEVYSLVESSRICDAKSVAGLLFYLEYVRKHPFQ